MPLPAIPVPQHAPAPSCPSLARHCPMYDAHCIAYHVARYVALGHPHYVAVEFAQRAMMTAAQRVSERLRFEARLEAQRTAKARDTEKRSIAAMKGWDRKRSFSAMFTISSATVYP